MTNAWTSFTLKRITYVKVYQHTYKREERNETLLYNFIV